MYVVQMKYSAKTRSILFLFFCIIAHLSLVFLVFVFSFFFSFGSLFEFFLRTIQFLDNGEDRGVAFELSKKDISLKLYPAISFASLGHRAIMRTKDSVMLKPAKR